MSLRAIITESTAMYYDCMEHGVHEERDGYALCLSVSKKKSYRELFMVKQKWVGNPWIMRVYSITIGENMVTI